jgi:hypothetical protein
MEVEFLARPVPDPQIASATSVSDGSRVVVESYPS